MAFSDLLGIYRCSKRKNYAEALKISSQLIKKFFINLYKGIYNVDFVVTSKDLKHFIDKLVKYKGFPFTKEEIEAAIEFSENIDVLSGDLEQKAKETYDYLSIFINKIHDYIIAT